MAEKNDFEPSFPEIIDVDMFDWQRADSPSILETKGLGPCFGVAAYDPDAKVGYMAHLVDPNIRDYTVKTFFETLLAAPNADKIKVWVRGSQLRAGDDLTHIEDIKNIRENVVDWLRKTGIQEDNLDVRWDQEDVRWGEEGKPGVNMRLNCSNGEFIEEQWPKYMLDEMPED